jgi:hypothetical protein
MTFAGQRALAYLACTVLPSLCALAGAVSAAEPNIGECAIAAQELEPADRSTAIYLAIANARQQPAAMLSANPDARVLSGTLWLNLGEPRAERTLKAALAAAQQRRLNIRLIAFGDDPAITGKTTLFHMIAEKKQLGRHPERLLTLLKEIRQNDYFLLVERHSEIPACMRVAAQNRVALDLQDAQKDLRRLDRSILFAQSRRSR